MGFIKRSLEYLAVTTIVYLLFYGLTCIWYWRFVHFFRWLLDMPYHVPGIRLAIAVFLFIWVLGFVSFTFFWTESSRRDSTGPK